MTTSSQRVASRRADSATATGRFRLSPAGIAVALFVVATVIALLGSWNVSLWTDEAATISAARRSTGELWQLVHNIDAVHAVYYFVIHFWGGAFGWSAFALRLPSALAAGATVVGVWSLARRLGRPDAALTAAVVAIVLPRITWMGIEARSFGLSAAIAVWATVALVVALRGERKTRAWAGYGILVAAGCALNIYVALLVVAHAVTVAALLAARAASVRRAAAWLVSAVLGVAIASPVVVASLGQRGQLGDNAVSAPALIRRAIVNQWFLGETPTRVGASSDGQSLWSLAALALAVVGWALIVVAVVALVRRRDRLAVVVALTWLLLPTAIVAVYSLAVSPLYNPRYFTFCAPAAALLIGIGITSLGRRWLRLGAVALVALLALPIYLSQRQETGKSGTDWSATAAWIDSHAQPGDGVYFAPLDTTTAATVERTTRNIAVAYPDDFVGLRDLTLVVAPTTDASLRGVSARLDASSKRLSDVKRVWVVRPSDYARESAAFDDAALESAGFHPKARFEGPMDDVLEYAR
ncbi:glycosyltransferase family 39 protein [Frondihabitans sp. Leaf304]|uniref:glycosyltransferase family 39 protein n=1 Tax=Frondihabitans sp. Leaf304 TaxID=1736329 RepID=UPI00138F0FCD|nr:DUF6056 family protein [Frondihabitans sp. Leaf304]